MASISLAKAGKLRNALERKSVKEPDWAATVLISDTEVLDDVEALYEEKKAAAKAFFEEEALRTWAVSTLRGLIAKANLESGIDQLLRDIERYKHLASQLRKAESDISYSIMTATRLDDIQAGLKFNATQEVNKKPPNRVRLKWLEEDSATWLSQFVGDVDYQQKITEAEDARNEINASTRIELPNELMALLRKYKLIA